jgi:hypothetical protein
MADGGRARLGRRTPRLVSATDYIINAIHVLLVLPQVREHRLDLLSLALPVVLAGAVAADYLHSVPTAGNDIALDLTLAAAGAILGVACALTTRMRRGTDAVALARAGVVAAILWIVGIGSRIAFAVYSSHGGGPAITQFSIAHDITSPAAWVTALVMMALAEVVSRLVTLRVRALRVPAAQVRPRGQTSAGS